MLDNRKEVLFLFMRLYSVLDKKTGIYQTPFASLTNGAAMRSFADLVSAPDNMVSKHPEDYSLYYLAAFDQENGCLDPTFPPQFLDNATAFVQQS